MKIKITAIEASKNYDGSVGVRYWYTASYAKRIDFKTRCVIQEGDVQEGYRIVADATETSLKPFVGKICDATFDSFDTPDGKFYFITKLELSKPLVKA